eukprot:TRINITY_DN2215_c0_g1_i1.p1 TRINITY_DN2215_c0_g1~~TRINITY_DN2215_c0_g1_i1.p1  ORF type:complete len:141 (-),score=45.65 TRINITY_DN2215_c0_g1_i1:113-499(-)
MSSNVQLIKEAYSNFTQGKIPEILQVLTDDVVWTAPDTVPWSKPGGWKGKEGVLEFFQSLNVGAIIHSFHPKTYYLSEDGTGVATVVDVEIENKTNNKKAQLEVCHQFQIRDSKIASFNEVYNTHKIL